MSAAIFAKEYLLNNVLSAVPEGASREEWLQALPQALVAGFVKTDIEFQQKGLSFFLVILVDYLVDDLIGYIIDPFLFFW